MKEYIKTLYNMLSDMASRLKTISTPTRAPHIQQTLPCTTTNKRGSIIFKPHILTLI
jgi:hypothetical protein